jgi:hypothetical protein
LEKGSGFELLAADVVKFEKPGVLGVEFGCGSGDLCREADADEEFVGKGGVDTIKTLTSVVGEACVFMVK